MSVLQDAFDNSPVLTSDDVPDNTPLPSQRDKSLYSNHDERAGIQQMPMYIREGDIRYSTTAPVQKAGDINYFVGGGGDEAVCPDAIFDSESGISATGYLYMIQQVVTAGEDMEIVLAAVKFQDGCIQFVSPNDSVIAFNQKDITSCGGTTQAFTGWPIENSGLVVQDGWSSS